MQAKSTPSKELLNKLFYYSEGNLYWIKARYIQQQGKPIKQPNTKTYSKCNVLGVPYLVHRLIYQMHYGDLSELMVVDHIDGNIYNNEISNLRQISFKENIQNRKNSKGYYLNKKSGKYTSSHMKDGVANFLGVFTTPESARTAYLTEREK